MKKFIFVLLMLFVGGFIGGCGGNSNSPINNTTASNIWTSSTGTATIKAASDDLEILTSRFGALSSDVIAKVGYEKPKDTTASIPRTVLYIDTEKKLLTGVIFITNSEDSVFKPIVYNNVSITKQGDDWVTPDGTRISSTSSTGSNSTITGSNSELSFSSSLTRKAHDTALKLENILPGTWTLDGTICGGSSGDLIMLPEKITMHFDSDLNADIFYSIMNNQTAMFQDAFSTKGTLTKLDSDVYKYAETDGTESLIFVENIDEIFMFRLNMLLPLKKTSFTPAKSWTAVSGGGYMKFNTATTNDPLLNLVETVSFTLKNGTLTVADDNSGSNNTTAVSFIYSFDVHNALLEAYGFKEVDNTDTTPMTFTPSGNFLKHTEGSEVYNLVFISEKEAFLGMTTNDENGEGKFVARFEAAE